MADTLYTTISSPIDDLLLTGDGERLTRLYMRPVDGSDWRIGPGWRRDAAPFADVESQLDAYFAGELRAFDVPLAPAGTAFQRAVWDLLLAIPFGETASLRRAGPAAGQAERLAGGRARQRQQPDLDHHPLPPGDRQHRLTDRLWRRPAPQGLAAGARASGRRPAGPALTGWNNGV